VVWFTFDQIRHQSQSHNSKWLNLFYSFCCSMSTSLLLNVELVLYIAKQKEIVLLTTCSICCGRLFTLCVGCARPVHCREWNRRLMPSRHCYRTEPSHSTIRPFLPTPLRYWKLCCHSPVNIKRCFLSSLWALLFMGVLRKEIAPGLLLKVKELMQKEKKWS